MKLLPKVLTLAFGFSGISGIVPYLFNNSSKSVVKKYTKTTKEEYDEWVKNRHCIAGDKDDDC